MYMVLFFIFICLIVKMFNSSNFALNWTNLFLSRNYILTLLKPSQRITFIHCLFSLRSAIECKKNLYHLTYHGLLFNINFMFHVYFIKINWNCCCESNTFISDMPKTVSKSFKGARTRYKINPLCPVKLCYQRSTGENKFEFDTLFK